MKRIRRQSKYRFGDVVKNGNTIMLLAANHSGRAINIVIANPTVDDRDAPFLGGVKGNKAIDEWLTDVNAEVLFNLTDLARQAYGTPT